ncbi:hypothetical protein GDO86_019307 [Hymenochirus boettgeri]|uniref:Uncharacterized protein n=1 Tax=Hymenochirus boettgeri TaxID=247094 RepID=A0A8T2ID13_9PIPI|nr:hypothetical protein GDO86_019307 [Hymenochirus boettgeri]
MRPFRQGAAIHPFSQQAEEEDTGTEDSDPSSPPPASSPSPPHLAPPQEMEASPNAQPPTPAPPRVDERLDSMERAMTAMARKMRRMEPDITFLKEKFNIYIFFCK